MRARTFLMFTGEAEDALAHYQKAFPALVIGAVKRHADGPMAGKILTAEAHLAGHGLLFHDSPPVHAFGFTPAMSIFVDVLGPQDLDDAYAVLLEGGTALMEVGDHGFSRRFAWVQDRYGVSWQLNLP